MGKPFRVASGLSYGDNKRAEVGAVITDLPEDDIADLLALGAIVPVKPKSTRGKK